MKFLSSLLFAVSLTVFAALPVAAQADETAPEPLTLEQVLAKHATARGGVEAWRQVQTMKLEGQYVAFGKGGDFVLYRSRPPAGDWTALGQMRFERPEPPYDAIIATDGETSWWVNPWVGVEWAVPLPTAEVDALLAETYFTNPLIDAEAKGNRIELVGKTDFEGNDAYELHVVLHNGLEETWFLDASTFLELGSLGTTADYGEVKEVKAFFDDFRTVEGLVMPFYVEREFGIRLRILEVETVEINPELSPDLFRFQVPEPDGMRRLASLVGEWDVAVRSRDNPSFIWEEGETTSTIEARFHGLQLVETLHHEVMQPRTIARTRAFDRFRQVYRDTLFHDGLFHPMVLEGTFGEDGRLVHQDIGAGSPGEGVPFLTRLTTSAITEDSFKVEEERSFDGGESWNLLLELTYTRRSAEP